MSDLDKGLTPVLPPMRDVAAVLNVPMPVIVRRAAERDAIALYDGAGASPQPIAKMKPYLKAVENEVERYRLADSRCASLVGIDGPPAHETSWAHHAASFEHAKLVRAGVVRGPW